MPLKTGFMSRRPTSDTRAAAEKAFKAATTKPPELLQRQRWRCRM